jgi:hypothetical protein
MKHMSLIFVFALMTFVTGCQDSKSKKSSSSSTYSSSCTQYPAAYGCPQYCTYNPTGYGCSATTSGTTSGSTTGNTSSDCSNVTNYYQSSSCPGYSICQTNPSYSSYCANYPGGSTGGTTGSTTNPFPNYASIYADKNWQVKYPYIPSIQNCPAPTTPSGISYTPYETRKGTVTVVGKGFNPVKNADPISWYDPRTYNTISDDRTSPLLRSVDEALKFFYTDSKMRVRIKANLQPDSSQSNPLCYGRISSQAWIKGYSRMKLDLYLIGVTKDDNGAVASYSTPELLVSDMTIGINYCSSVLDLSSFNGVNYPSKYPDGFFLVIKNVRGNQNWAPGTQAEQQAFDTYGFYPNSKYDGNSYMQAIRGNDCWSVDIEVAADGTKTF